jgi:ABC-type polysaccharide/polyol phosphate transport system ATPase subunit
MQPTVVSFQGVSKGYQLRRSLARAAQFWDPEKHANTFWALDDVSFEIARGDTVGLIGPNGAGKSTILKILARVTVPTKGSFSVKGRLGALIEVGAGFHPDLTGRENVFLNGAIMGMRKREIDAKFDQIVAFSEVEKFLDTPLKYYSSGMMVRLGFAVAAHIDPDILLVDEVLAVGDTAFQAKCLNKIAELKEQERTIVLVSHAMPSILQHSSKVLWIDHGQIQGYGDPDETVEAYLRTVHRDIDDKPAVDPSLTTDSPIHLESIVVRDARNEANEVLRYGEPAHIDIAYRVSREVDEPVLAVTFQDVRDYPLGGLTTRFDRVVINNTPGTHTARLVLSPVLFTRGSYGITVSIHDSRIQRYLDMRPRAATFMVDGPSVATREISGHFVFPHAWDSEIVIAAPSEPILP